MGAGPTLTVERSTRRPWLMRGRVSGVYRGRELEGQLAPINLDLVAGHVDRCVGADALRVYHADGRGGRVDSRAIAMLVDVARVAIEAAIVARSRELREAATQADS